MQTEPDDSTVAELFARDPLDLSKQDLDTIIAKLRAQRHRFVLGNAKAGTPEAKKSKATKEQEAAAKVAGDIDLSGLGL